MTDATPINLAVTPSALVDNHMVFVVRSVGANVKRKHGKGERTTWATLDSPADKELKIAIPLYPGAGARPDDTISLTELHDLAVQVMQSLEFALDDMDAEPEGDW